MRLLFLVCAKAHFKEFKIILRFLHCKNTGFIVTMKKTGLENR